MLGIVLIKCNSKYFRSSLNFKIPGIFILRNVSDLPDVKPAVEHLFSNYLHFFEHLCTR